MLYHLKMLIIIKVLNHTELRNLNFIQISKFQSKQSIFLILK